MNGHTFDAAIGDAGRRRLRTVAAGGAAAAVAVALFGLVPHPAGSSGLEPAGTPPVTATPRPDAGVPPTASPSPAVTGVPVPEQPVGGITPAAKPRADGAPTGHEPARSAPGLAYHPPFERPDLPHCSLRNDTGYGTRSGDWCFVITPGTSDDDKGVGLRLEVCSEAPQGGTLEFAGTMARVLVTTTSGDTVWQTGPTTNSVRSVWVGYGTCASWDVIWDRSGPDGKRVADGSYVVRGMLLATNVQGSDSVPFTLP